MTPRRTRPGDYGRLVFFSHADSGKLEELGADARANVSLQAGGRFVSVSGEARSFRDPARAKALWQESQREWFPDGPEDASLVLIEIEPSFVEFWDQSSVSALRLIMNPSPAKLEALGEGAEHAKIPMRGRSAAG